MKRSTDRILTMHAGSLARPPDLREMVVSKSNGEPYDEAILAERLRRAVAEVVQQQVAVGLDSINDGEFSKIDYSARINAWDSGIKQPLRALPV